MLHELVSSHRSELLSRTRSEGWAEPSPSTPTRPPERGVPLFLSQLAETLRLEGAGLPSSPTAVGEGAASHARELFAAGSTIARVVDDYGAACLAVAELAVDEEPTLGAAELRTVARCLHTAIAEAVTEYERLKEVAAAQREQERSARLAHDLRNLVQTALLSFKVLEAGKAPPSGNAGRVLGRSLAGIRDLADGIVSPQVGAEGHPEGARTSAAR